MSRKVVQALQVAVFVMTALASEAQIPPELIRYPDAALVNGKILAFEGPLMSERLVFHEAIAIRDGKVLALGTDEQILRLKGPNTLTIDLKGKAVLPGFVDNHNHPHEWIHYFRYDSFIPNVKLVFVPGPDDEFRENRPDIFYGWGPLLKNPPMEIVQSLESRLKQAAAELGPGSDKWILATVTRQGMHLVGSVINKEWLDGIVPNNSVMVVSDFIPHPVTANSTALKAIMESDPDPYMAALFKDLEEKGSNPSMAVSMRLYVGVQVIGAKNFEEFKQSLKYVMLEIAKYGATSIGGRVDYPTDLAAEAELARTGQAPLRYGWSHHLMRRLLGTESAPRAFSLVGDFSGIGSDLFWNIGAGAEGPPDIPFAQVLCTSARVREEYAEVHSPFCGLLTNSQMREGISRMVASRVRVAGIHGSADMTLDLLMEAVREGMRSSGLTIEDVRKMRITFDHVLLARPDQVEKVKEFGMIPAVTPLYIYQADEIIDMFGPQIEEWLFLVNSFVEEGIPVTVNLDRIPTDAHPYFDELQFLITRNFRGKVYNAKEAVDRATALKAVTIWSARYLVREDVIGNLNPGYLADLMVLDKDYFTVPEDQIHTIRVLMTVMGSKITWVDKTFERELPGGYENVLHPTFVEFRQRIQGSQPGSPF